MSSRLATIADAVAASITAAQEAETLSLPFNISRKYIPAEKREDLTTLTVTVVVPDAVDYEPLSRAAWMRMPSLTIGVQKALAVGTDPTSGDTAVLEEIDPLLQFVEELADLWTPSYRIGSVGAALSRKSLVAHDKEKLNTLSVFQSVLTLTFKY